MANYAIGQKATLPVGHQMATGTLLKPLEITIIGIDSDTNGKPIYTAQYESKGKTRYTTVSEHELPTPAIVEPTIPQNVIEVLADVRASGGANMVDRRAVIELATIFDEDASEWLDDNKARYMDALNAMGEFISKPKDAPVITCQRCESPVEHDGDTCVECQASIDIDTQWCAERDAAAKAAIAKRLNVPNPVNEGAASLKDFDEAESAPILENVAKDAIRRAKETHGKHLAYVAVVWADEVVFVKAYQRPSYAYKYADKLFNIDCPEMAVIDDPKEPTRVWRFGKNDSWCGI